MSVTYQAVIAAGASLQALSSPAFNFGTGDFTVAAMCSTSTGGAVVARQGVDGAGFRLVINPDSTIRFVIAGTSFIEAVTAPTSILSAGCHSVVAVQKAGLPSIYLDGRDVTSARSTGGAGSLEVNNSQPLMIGSTIFAAEPNKQYVGAIMNVGVWSVALFGDQIVRAAFGRISAFDPGLRGYWTLNQSTDDFSNNNNPANIIGFVTYAPCLQCVWTEGANAYSYTRITNYPEGSGGANGNPVTLQLTHRITVPAGSPALAFSIMADQVQPAFPSGVSIALTDPNGTCYNQAANTATLFAALSGGQLWALMAINPVAGIWTISVTAPSTTGFQLGIHTIPSASVVPTIQSALRPLCDGMSARLQQMGFWSDLAEVAAVVVAGVVVVAATLVGGPALGAAVTVGIVGFAASVSSLQAGSIIPVINPTNLPVASGQIAGMAGFTTSPQTVLLLDANCSDDTITQLIYSERKHLIYDYVTASPFNANQVIRKEADMSAVKVATALSGFSRGLITACGHGANDSLMGWYISTIGGPLQEVLKTGSFTEAQVAGKIFHLHACKCGSTVVSGLGRNLVSRGAVAFFGYSDSFKMTSTLTPAQLTIFCAPDIALVRALIDGKTCAEAHQAAVKSYDDGHAELLDAGFLPLAIVLQENRDLLVSPSTNTIYGDPKAKLNRGS